MKKYIGVKAVYAEQSKSAKDYGEHKAGEDGYKVVYKDGYESWSPKDVFEEAYRDPEMYPLTATAIGMQSVDYKERFIAEYDQLSIRYNSLKTMLEKYNNGTLNFEPNCSYELLYRQLIHMAEYKADLEERAIVECVDLKKTNQKSWKS